MSYIGRDSSKFQFMIGETNFRHLVIGNQMRITHFHSLLTVCDKHASNDLSSYKQHQPTLSPYFSPCNPKQQTNQQNYDDLQHLTNEFDGCYHVFLDVGSNLGNTVR